MQLRCPYCKQELDTPSSPRCPSCNRMMRIPIKRDREKIKLRKRTLERIEREADKQRQTIHHGLSLDVLRSPRVLFPALLVLTFLGAVLISASGKVHKRSIVRSPHSVALKDLNVLATALGRYRYHVGTYPTNNNMGLRALRFYDGEEDWNGPYVSHVRPDPWKNPYIYMIDSNSQAVVFSAGPDGIRGTDDDLYPDPASFIVGTDWTNGWVPAIERIPGVKIIKPQDVQKQ